LIRLCLHFLSSAAMVSWRSACTLVVFSPAVASQGVCSDRSNHDQTSLMQGRVHSSLALETQSSDLHTSGREHSLVTMMDSATNLVKAGATPEVVEFVNLTLIEINATKLLVIEEHDLDQTSIDNALKALTNLKANYTSLVESEEHTGNKTDRAAKSIAHQHCRYQEALQCTRTRRCHWELEKLWDWVEVKESDLRAIHTKVDGLWCLATEVEREALEPHLNDSPFDWANVGDPYPTITLESTILDFRQYTVEYFGTYKTRLAEVQYAWSAYNEKATECTGHDNVLDSKIIECDGIQDSLDTVACTHATTSSSAHKNFGTSWTAHMDIYYQAISSGYLKQEDRKREYETLEIIDCLLTVVYIRVERAVNDGIPCITEESDPNRTNSDIDTCHHITTGFTDHLTLVNGTVPSLPNSPHVDPITCSPAYIALEYSSFPSGSTQGTHTQVQYSSDMTDIIDAPFANGAYTDVEQRWTAMPTTYHTEIGRGGWPGCAAPHLCHKCDVPAPGDPQEKGNEKACQFHQDHLQPGESDADSFRCLTGGCVPYGARCNGHFNCGDQSDESLCGSDTPYDGPAAIDLPQICPDPDLDSMDHLFKCTGVSTGDCTSAASQCHDGKNCGEQDASCAGNMAVLVESTTGRTASVDPFDSVTSTVFHDRTYTFSNEGSFKTADTYFYVKTSNDDKDVDDDHVALKVTIDRPATFYVVTTMDCSGPDEQPHWLTGPTGSHWLTTGGWTLTSMTGPTYGGVAPLTPHSEWNTALQVPDTIIPGSVYRKTFPAGVINLPGNGVDARSSLWFLEAAWVKQEGGWKYEDNKDDYCVDNADDRQHWAYDSSGNAGGWRWCSISQQDCQDSCVNLGGCKAIFYTENGCCFPSKNDFVAGTKFPGGIGGFKVSRQR